MRSPRIILLHVFLKNLFQGYLYLMQVTDVRQALYCTFQISFARLIKHINYRQSDGGCSRARALQIVRPKASNDRSCYLCTPGQHQQCELCLHKVFI